MVHGTREGREASDMIHWHKDTCACTKSLSCVSHVIENRYIGQSETVSLIDSLNVT